MQGGCHDAPLHLLGRILAVPDPHVHPLARGDPEERLPGRDGERLDGQERALADSADSDSGADVLANELETVDELAGLDCLRVDPLERRRGDTG